MGCCWPVSAGVPDTAEGEAERGGPTAGQARDARGLRPARLVGPGLQPILEKGALNFLTILVWKGVDRVLMHWH